MRSEIRKSSSIKEDFMRVVELKIQDLPSEEGDKLDSIDLLLMSESLCL
jgi:hypothetical protein